MENKRKLKMGAFDLEERGGRKWWGSVFFSGPQKFNPPKMEREREREREVGLWNYPSTSN